MKTQYPFLRNEAKYYGFSPSVLSAKSAEIRDSDREEKMSKALKVFITYSHKDLQQNTELKTRLAVMADEGKIELWDDNKILPGDEWEKDISDNLAESDILLYLTSAASLASKNCNKELAEALGANIRVIPIILESCDWKHHQLNRFEALPHKCKPINKWQPESDGWQNVVTGIRKVVDEMRPQLDSSTGTPNDHLRAELAFQQGSVFIMLGQMTKAIEAYSRSIEFYPNNPATYNNRAVAYYITGDYDRVIADYTKVIELKSDNTEAYYNRGKTYKEKGNNDLAIADFNTVIHLKSDYTNAYIDRGIAYYDKGEYDFAIADYTKAIALHPNHANAYNNRGNAYIGKGEYDPAIKNFDKAIGLEPNNATAYYNLGNAYTRKNDNDHAIENYTRAIEIKRDYAEAYFIRGVTYNFKGHYNLAIEDFTKAIQFQPHNADAHNNRGMAYYKQGMNDLAIKDYTKTIDLNPNHANAYSNRGLAYNNKHHFDLAIKDFNKSIRLNSHDADAYYNRGVTYGKQSKVNRAIEDYTRAIALNPNFAEAYYDRANSYRVKGDYDLAIEDFTRTVELNPNHADAYNNRGGVYISKGEFDKAIMDCSAAIELSPNYAIAYNNRGIAYSNKGEFDLTIADYTKAIDLNPEYSIAYCNRGNAYSAIGNFYRAIGDYTKSIELDSNYAIAYYNRGSAYSAIGNFERAITDYTAVITLNAEFVPAYSSRGFVWLHKEEWDKAKEDLTTASEKGTDIAALFHNDYKNVEAYERANRVKLPDDIAAMLTQPRRTRFPRTEKFLSSDGTPIESPDVSNLREKLRNAGTPLSQYLQTRPTFGIKTGSSGAFVVDSATRDRLIAAQPASVDILRPFLHGRNIRRWGVARPDSWLIFTYRRIEINRYPAIRKHLEKYRSPLSKRAGKQKWYELPAAKRDADRFTQTKLVCPNSYNHQAFAVDSEGFYCGDTCYLIPTEETWLCGLLNSRVVEWYYSQASNQLTDDYLKARSRYIQQIPIPDLTPTQKSLIGKIVDYLIYLQGQPTTSGGDLAHSRDFIMLKYFERIIDGLVYESYLSEELHQGEKHFFKPLLDEGLPQIEEIQGDKMSALREIFERLYERTHLVRINLFFLDSVKPIRIIEGKA